jgi:hypothetical protein
MKTLNIDRGYPHRNLIRVGYEELRGSVINYGESVLRKPPGINLFYRLGMFGWLEECGKLTLLRHDSEMETTRAGKQESTEPILPDIREQVVNLLSNMILSTTG